MRRDNELAREPFRAASLWVEAARRFEREFYLAGIDQVETQYYNVRFFGYTPGDRRLYDYLLYTYYQLVRQRDDLGLMEKAPATCPVGPGFAVDVDGFRVSLDQLLSIDDFYSMREVCPGIATEPLVVAEIGAGWGRLGYVLKRANPQAAYLVFDLPEVLLLSSTYLPRLLPGLVVTQYEQARALDRLEHSQLLDGGMWFLGSQDIEKLANGSVDLFVNVASFQEMTRRQVEKYFEILGRKAKGGGLYLRQLWNGSTHGHRLGEVAGHADYPFPPGWRQLFLRNSRFSQLFFESGYSI